MNVNLSDGIQAFVDQKVASGQYASVDEIVETALLELRNLETGELDKRWLQAKLKAGRISLDLDGGLSVDELRQRMHRVRDILQSGLKHETGDGPSIEAGCIRS